MGRDEAEDGRGFLWAACGGVEEEEMEEMAVVVGKEAEPKESSVDSQSFCERAIGGASLER